ncbi:3-hydroxy-3-methylglutaryl CoA synthase [Desulfacinum hydrothermale DSM 13146]|uniref:3-hydroxy-3-methylglutaryl CoA synthase n=1 Tax=Desulfacinum hydrothermale DSM 13146 TaxID=1121390 RepID=A0A1W1WZC3_9BACT|nr:3-oxoacyl-[acyl-carrier-protein] synthase III C-terminal domain-containing protein [Desulfacinum hydrothermale]SMC17082.1 3-hydroxy-3-methylglutaryl CoA synthase [Desulfacinum hydrothermale DSM 13146]
MVGLTAYGAYVPRYRLERKTAAQAMGWLNPTVWALAGGEKAVANVDEDSITLAVAAVRNAHNGPDPLCGALHVASTTFPYARRQNAVIVREALNLPEGAAALDVTGSTRAGTSALLAALNQVASGAVRRAWVAAADVHRAKMGSADELLYGDGGAALAVGDEEVLAAFVGSFTLTADFPDHLRETEKPLPRSWEERWVRDEGYLSLIPRAVGAYMEKAGLSPEEVAAVIYPCPYVREHAAMGKRLGLPPEKVADPLAAQLGDTGAAHPLLMLCRALESASPGDHLLVVGFGNGVDVLHFQATDAVVSFQPAKTFDALLARRAPLVPYEKALAFRELTPVETGIRGEFQAEPPLSVLWRNRRAVLGLQGTRCSRCGTPQFPPQRICAVPECQAVDETEPYLFSHRSARIFSYTGDNLAFSLDPPQIYGIVDFDEGGRMMLDFTDCSLEAIQVDQPVELHLRRKYHDAHRGVHTYFWKAVPIETPQR